MERVREAAEFAMDYFGREELQELLEVREAPAVSIYLPTSRGSSEWEADRLRFRAAVGRARELLEPDYEPSRYRTVLEGLQALLGDQEFWLSQSDGLALFRAPGFGRTYRLPTRLPELVVVGPNFHTRPLLQVLQAPDRFWILCLSQKQVRLWEGTLTGLREVDLAGVPGSMAEAVSRFVDYGEETLHSSYGRGRNLTYHGHGPGRDALDWEREAFFRRVDEGLRELLRPEAGPVILAGVEAEVSLYRSVSRLRSLAEEAVRGNVSRWNADRLERAARPIVERLVDRRIQDAGALWEAAYAVGKTESDLAGSARLAVAGRVRLVMTDRDRRIWGHLDRVTGAVRIVGENGEDPGDNAVDLLDELAEVVILRGGEALAIPGSRMPTATGVATVLR